MTSLSIRISNGVFPITIAKNLNEQNQFLLFGTVEWIFYGIACEKGDISPIMKYVIKNEEGKSIFHGEFSVRGSVGWMWELLAINELNRRMAEEHFALAITPIYQARNGSNTVILLKEVDPERDGGSIIFNQWAVSGNGNNTMDSKLSAENAGKDGYNGAERLECEYRMRATPAEENQSGTVL